VITSSQLARTRVAASRALLPAATSFKDVDANLLDQYVHIVGGTDRERVMQARGLLANGELSAAGCLLFAQTLRPGSQKPSCAYFGTAAGSAARARDSSSSRMIALKGRFRSSSPAREEG
jgi:hypothetical protein